MSRTLYNKLAKINTTDVHLFARHCVAFLSLYHALCVMKAVDEGPEAFIMCKPAGVLVPFGMHRKDVVFRPKCLVPSPLFLQRAAQLQILRRMICCIHVSWKCIAVWFTFVFHWFSVDFFL